MKDWEKWEDNWSVDKIRSIWSRHQGECKTDKVRVHTSKLAGESILDVGCGGGMQYPSYVDAHPKGKYTGVDVTPKMIHVAKEFHKGADFQVTDGADLPFKYGDYDSVLLRHLVEHHPAHNAAAIIDNALRVCKKNTIIVFFIPPKENGLPEEKTEGGFYATVYSREWVQENWGLVCEITWHDYPDSNEVICVLTPKEDMESFWFKHRTGIKTEEPSEELKEIAKDVVEDIKKEIEMKVGEKIMKEIPQVFVKPEYLEGVKIEEGTHKGVHFPAEEIQKAHEEVSEPMELKHEPIEEFPDMMKPSAPEVNYFQANASDEPWPYEVSYPETKDACDGCDGDGQYEEPKRKIDKTIIINNEDGGVINITIN